MVKHNNFKKMIQESRTKRLYKDLNVSFNTLTQIIEDCRFSSSTMNRQDVRYIIINDNKIADEIFNITNLPSKHNVPLNKRPKAFIIMVVEKTNKLPDSYLYYNLGIITANLTLSAYTLGYSCVTLLSTNLIKLADIIQLDNSKKVVSVVAVGISDQKVITKTVENGNTDYYYNEKDILVVPKLSAKTLIINKI